MGCSRDLTAVVKAMALEAGFVRVGVASVGEAPDAEAFRRWLARGFHGTMAYLARNVEARLTPARLVPGARSVLCLAVSYAPQAQGEHGDSPDSALPLRFCGASRDSGGRGPEGAKALGRGCQPPVPCALPSSPPPRRGGSEACQGSETPRSCSAGDWLVARYARGRDYHRVLKRRCHRLMDRIREMEPAFEGRAFVDSGPVLERSLAAAVGIGWIGRNHCLTCPGLGSYVFLCEIISNLPLAADGSEASQCQGCDACVRACPTGALTPEGLDARRCLSYLTVEHRGPIGPEFWPLFGRRPIGCDACQAACPHNRDVPPGDPELLATKPPLGGAGLADVLGWMMGDWDAATRGSAARRASHAMFLRNAVLASGSAARPAEAPALAAALEHLGPARPELAAEIAWAQKRLAALPAG